MPPRRLTEQQLTDTIREVIENARQREAAYLPRAVGLTEEQKNHVRAFFPGQLLNQVKVLELEGERLLNPAFQQRAEGRGYRLMLDFSHKAQIAHPKLIIFQEKITPRLLFHALVHVTQYAALGLERYLELYVRAFAQTGTYTSVPFEIQAFRLDQHYTEHPERPFSVEEEVRQWFESGGYTVPASTERKHGT